MILFDFKRFERVLIAIWDGFNFGPDGLLNCDVA